MLDAIQMFRFLSVSLLLSSFAFAQQQQVITLTNGNFVSLVGPVTSSNVDSVLQLFNDPATISHMKDNRHVYLYVNSPGGSVLDGYRLIQHIRTLQAQNVSVDCIGQNFMSMGFAIMQSCTKRLVMLNSLGMQHPMSTIMMGNVQNIRSHLEMIDSMHEEMVAMELQRLNISREAYEGKILRDWWMFGTDLLKQNAADEQVFVQCLPDVSVLFIRRTERILGSSSSIETNKCPLINYIHTEEKNMTKYFDANLYRADHRAILRDLV